MTDWNQVPELFGSEHPVKVPAKQRREFREVQRKLYEDRISQLTESLHSGKVESASATLSEMVALLSVESGMPGPGWIPEQILHTAMVLFKWASGCKVPEHRPSEETVHRLMHSLNGLLPFYKYHVRSSICLPYHQVALLRAISLLQANTQAADWLHQTMQTLENPHHPGHFLTGSWQEFKYVPDQVRNHTINHSISVTKGDLPAAAEHLEFSYRNIRSYITFRQVNRLGNFRHERTTREPEFERGVRILLETLVEKGHIFEMIFDLPGFLVEHRNLPFSSQDLEEALDIRSSTAKKYLSICESMGIIRRTAGKNKRTMFLPNESLILHTAKGH